MKSTLFDQRFKIFCSCSTSRKLGTAPHRAISVTRTDSVISCAWSHRTNFKPRRCFKSSKNIIGLTSRRWVQKEVTARAACKSSANTPIRPTFVLPKNIRYWATTLRLNMINYSIDCSRSLKRVLSSASAKEIRFTPFLRPLEDLIEQAIFF